MLENLKEILSNIFTISEKIVESQIKYEDITTTEITLTSKKYFRNLNNLTTLTLSIDSNSNNSCLLFSTGDTITFNCSIDTTFKINKAFNFEANKTYLIAVDNYSIIWSELQNYEA